MLSCSHSAADKLPYKYQYLYEDLSFEMPRIEIPIFPKYRVNLLDFGGKSDGITLNTEAFEKAMQSLSEKGGGTLVVPKGIGLRARLFLDQISICISKKGFNFVFTRFRFVSSCKNGI
jgi:hypothetical protein